MNFFGVFVIFCCGLLTAADHPTRRLVDHVVLVTTTFSNARIVFSGCVVDQTHVVTSWIPEDAELLVAGRQAKIVDSDEKDQLSLLEVDLGKQSDSQIRQVRKPVRFSPTKDVTIVSRGSGEIIQGVASPQFAGNWLLLPSFGATRIAPGACIFSSRGDLISIVVGYDYEVGLHERSDDNTSWMIAVLPEAFRSFITKAR